MLPLQAETLSSIEMVKKKKYKSKGQRRSSLITNSYMNRLYHDEANQITLISQLGRGSVQNHSLSKDRENNNSFNGGLFPEETLTDFLCTSVTSGPLAEVGKEIGFTDVDLSYFQEQRKISVTALRLVDKLVRCDTHALSHAEVKHRGVLTPHYEGVLIDDDRKMQVDLEEIKEKIASGKMKKTYDMHSLEVAYANKDLWQNSFKLDDKLESSEMARNKILEQLYTMRDELDKENQPANKRKRPITGEHYKSV